VGARPRLRSELEDVAPGDTYHQGKVDPMIGFLLMLVFLLGFTCCSAVESFFVPPGEPDATPRQPEARAGVDALGRVRAYKATGPYYKESRSPLDVVPLGHELGDGHVEGLEDLHRLVTR
jgi:hypothetical protein